MDVSTFKKTLNAMKVAGIKNYVLLTDIGPTHLYNDGINKFNVLDETNATIINFRPVETAATRTFTGPILVQSAGLDHISEMRFGANAESAKKFAEVYGITLTDEQKQMLVNIQGGNNSKIIPPSPDYTFRVLSEEEIEVLTPEQKEEYDKKLKEFKKSRMSSPVQIN